MSVREQIKENYQNGCHLKTISQNNPISNQHIAEINVNTHTKYQVFMTIHVGRRANQRKIPKQLRLKNFKSESLNILCAYMGDICAYACQI